MPNPAFFHLMKKKIIYKGKWILKLPTFSTRAGSLNHFSGELDRGEPDRSGSPRSGSPLNDLKIQLSEKK